jgi:probable metal-binding protein
MEVHIHEILQMMAAAGQGWTREGLAQAVVDTFGEEARFATCSGSGLDAREAVAFIEARGKLMGPEDALQLDPGNPCACDAREG